MFGCGVHVFPLKQLLLCNFRGDDGLDFEGVFDNLPFLIS